MPSNPNIKRTWFEVEIESGQYTTICVVETDLELNPSGPRYDPTALAAILSAVEKETAAQNIRYNRIRIVPYDVK